MLREVRTFLVTKVFTDFLQTHQREKILAVEIYQNLQIHGISDNNKPENPKQKFFRKQKKTRDQSISELFLYLVQKERKRKEKEKLKAKLSERRARI